MTIKEFLQAGGQIDPTFQSIDKCEDSWSGTLRTWRLFATIRFKFS